MKKVRGQVLLGILFLVLISCNDDLENSKVKPDEVTPDAQSEEKKVKGTNGKVASYLVGEWTDASGKVHIRQYGHYTNFLENPSESVSTFLDDGYVVVGGGATVDYGGYNPDWGALLTESRPDFENNSWVGASKAHIEHCFHQLFITTVGMKLDGVSAAELKSRMIVITNTSGASNTPVSQAHLPSGYTLIGGGAKVTWSGWGNLLMYSYPLDLDSWSAGGKAHIKSSPATITSYAIGIKKDGIPNFGNLLIKINEKQSLIATGAKNSSTTVDPGWASTCPGGYSNYQGYGRMLTNLIAGRTFCTATSSDHIYPDQGYVTAYGIMVKKE